VTSDLQQDDVMHLGGHFAEQHRTLRQLLQLLGLINSGAASAWAAARAGEREREFTVGT
jgi:hypothetical protein